MSPAVRRRRPVTALGLLLLLGCLAACASEPSPRPGPAASPAGGSQAGVSPFWVDPNSAAARQVAAWEAQGRNTDAQLLRRISERPMALWAPGGDPGPAVRRAAAAAKAAGRTLLVAAYNLPHRDVPHPGCAARPTTEGAPDAHAYEDWIDALARSLADTRALVVLEPGAVAHLVDGCAGAGPREERYRLLAQAVDRLKRNRHTRVYLDAGHPDWIRDPDDLVEPLRRSGLERADGFALNVAAYHRDADGRAYGVRLSRAVGGKHFVLDTSRNGDGPPPAGPNADTAADRSWCNPAGRSLGTPPTDRTGDPLVDAYLWVKRPGESDGTCRGGPAAGTWWPDHALGLARRARD
ncbi:glycoside hydrolase family 6 protein [Streptomyces sp. RerS4]|uniref:glycoside hydrolase family 6 protein n=1 Tax=Streptomyces sp. RerS4 TaxID=2942449 RepID=UPI00201BE0F3|nr:glycoside hydrolase family 6 protein [Streptomyces sp. RerS4]UQX03045.1 glycoside hydrolase family 6 protein [Streptomyces sp. RerS4]